MTRRVLKWTVPVDDHTHQIGSGPVVHVACQRSIDEVQVWTEDSGDESRTVRVYGTGHPLPATARHIGTAIPAGVALVWHVYEVEAGGDT